MKKQILHWLLFSAILILLSGCGEGDSRSTSSAQALINDNTPVVVTTPTGAVVGTLEGLTDLGDLVAPQGDHWYYTKPVAINYNGIVVGTSNKGAFMWDPATEFMNSLGIHTELYNDYYFRMIIDPVDPPVGFFKSIAVDLNSGKDIIGNSFSGADGKRAFIIQGGTFIDLPPILDTREEFEIHSYSEAVDVNEQGEVVLTLDDNLGRHAYYWDGQSYHTVTLSTDDVITRIVTVPSYVALARIVGEDAAAVAINENKHIAINSGDTAIFIDLNWGVTESLNHLPGATKTVAVDINDSAYTNNDGIADAHIIGNSGSGSLELKDDDSVRGFFWDGGAMYPVDHLGGGTSVTTDINNKDQVVGAATTDSETYHAFLWTLDPSTEKGVMRDLGTLGGDLSYATAINEAGQVTGWSETGVFYKEADIVVPVRHAFLWSDGIMYDLGTHNDFYDYPFIPSFPFSEGVAINAKGEVTGSSTTINDHHRGFLLSPTFP